MHKIEKGGPDPGNGAADPDILQKKWFREGSFCAKMKVNPIRNPVRSTGNFRGPFGAKYKGTPIQNPARSAGRFWGRFQ